MSNKSVYKINYIETCSIIENSFSKFLSQYKKMKPTKTLVIYDSFIKGYAKNFCKKIKADFFYEFSVSEGLKSKEHFFEIQKIFYNLKLDKNSVVVVIGGGVLGDLVGFSCHAYMRGIRWISVPSTLLAQVDSGVGGKNAINTSYAKNISGTVYQPSIVYIDLSLLKSLSNRDIISGYGEILKYYILHPKIKNPSFLNKRDVSKELSQIVGKCIRYKMSLVEKDPHDRLGVRQQLNLGHTLAHALENITHFKRYRHGEAVIWGLKFALIVSRNKKMLNHFQYQKLMSYLNLIPVPDLPSVRYTDLLYELCLMDKKSENQTVKMVLIQSPGHVKCSIPVGKKDFLDAYVQLKKQN